MLAYSLRTLLPSITRTLPRPHAVIGSSVHPFAAWAGLLLADRHQVPFLFEVRDLWPQTLIDMGRLREGSLLTRQLQTMEKWLYSRAAAVIALLPRAVDYLVPLGVPAHKIVWIPNGVDLNAFPAPPPPTDRNDFTLMYFGAHGQANGLEILLQAMQAVAKAESIRPIRLRMVGDGPLKSTLIRKARELCLTNVSFEAPVPKREIPDLAAQADAFVFNLIDAPVFKYGISSNKLFDFMAGGRPIVFCSNSANNPVAEAGAGITVKPGDVQALANALIDMASLSLSRRIRMGQAARHYVEQNHNLDRLTAMLAKTLNVHAGGL
jgi:glycosyltransferase involved in cell wall biosynthesis